MYIPRTRKITQWASEIVAQCHSDLEERIQRGALYRNLYLTGDENGQPATYPKTYEYIDNLASFLFSPVTLKFALRFHNGGTLSDRKMGRTISSDMDDRLSEAGVYSAIEDCTEWSLVKGKTILKLNWEGGNFAPYMIQPEFFGVLRPDLADLSAQPAFVHSTYYTPDEFISAFRELPNLAEVMREVKKRARISPAERPDRANALKQIVLGGLNPYQQAGTSPATATSRGIVNWLGGPQAIFDPKMMAQLFRLDELWAFDSTTDDWATFQMVGDVMITGKETVRNAFADNWDPDNELRRLPAQFRENNPLSGKHPFIEFCPNRLDGYFWGRSEICNVGVLQMQINSRLNGIARLLRLQERPPRLFTGTTGINQQRYSALDKPNGFFVDPTPNAKQTPLYPEMPPDLWTSLHEYLQMFSAMAGLPPVLQGMGDSGVRAQGHAETLTRNASPRFKQRALSVERSVSEVGSLALSMLRAMDPRTMVAWLDPGTQNVVALLPPDQETLEPPAPGMHQFPFRYYHVPETVKVRVDSHSSSPIFSEEFRQLIFGLAKIGAMTPEEVIEHVNPPGEEDILADNERKRLANEKTLAEHPELLAKLSGGRKR